MTTRQTILENLNRYLNQQMTLLELVYWAENMLVEPAFPDGEDVDLLMDVLMYLGAADTRGFPLTWDVISDFVTCLGVQCASWSKSRSH
jgi:hypothetical protein